MCDNTEDVLRVFTTFVMSGIIGGVHKLCFRLAAYSMKRRRILCYGPRKERIFFNFLPSIRNTLKGKLKGRKEKGLEYIVSLYYIIYVCTLFCAF